MTSIMGWVSYDSRALSAFHLISDSRITWGSKNRRWDAGRKLFACTTSPDLLGYCGDVLFPLLTLGQIVEAANSGLLLNPEDDANERHRIIVERIKDSFRHRHNAVDRFFEIFHVARDGSGMSCSFKAWKTTFNPVNPSWNDEAIAIPAITEVAFISGTGSSSVKYNKDKWFSSDIKGTSRSLFGAFCDSLLEEDDPLSGGAPQLVSIYKKGSGRSIGIVHNNKRYFHGLSLDADIGVDNIEWRDANFQITDGKTLQLAKGAQKQPRPSKI